MVYNCCALPDMILAAGLGDPAQLVGCHQLFEVVHPLPQHLTLVGVLYKDAMIFGFQDILLRDDVQIFLHSLFRAFIF